MLGLACEARISQAQETRARQLFERLPQHQEGRYRHPHVAPSGQKIAFSASNHTGRNNTIWIYDLESEQSHELTKFDSTTTIGDYFVRWSPDGEHLAFASDRMGENHIWLVQADGGPARRLTEKPINTETEGCGVCYSNFSWSPDGSQIVYTDGDNEIANLYTLDLVGGETKQLTDLAGENRWPNWGSDGNKIIYVRVQEGANEFWTLNLQSGEHKKVNIKGGGGTNPTWSPNMEWIAFQQREPSFGRATYITRYSNGETHRVGATDYASGGAVWDRSGERLIYHSAKNTGPLVLFDVKTGLSKTVLESFRPLAYANQWASWSPDGRYLAFYRIIYGVSGKPEIALYTMSAADRGLKRIVSSVFQKDYFKKQAPDWIPDQNLLVSIVEGAGNSQIITADTSGNHLQTLTSSNTIKSEISASPDGEIVAFIAMQDKDKGEDIWLYDMALEEELQLTFSGGEKSQISFSPDGINIAYIGRQDADDSRSLYLVSAETGTEKQYSSDKAEYYFPSWLDSDKIYCEVKLDSTRRAEVLTLSDDRWNLLYSHGNRKFKCTYLTKDLASLYYVESGWKGSNMQKIEIAKGLVSTFINDIVAGPIFSPNEAQVVYVRRFGSGPTHSIWAEDVRHIIQASNLP